jgi:hypothetical protein
MDGASEGPPPPEAGDGSGRPPGEVKVSFTITAEDLVKAKLESMNRPRLFMVFTVAWTVLVWQAFAYVFCSRMDARQYAMAAALAGAVALWSLTSVTKTRVFRQSVRLSATPILQGVATLTLDSRGVRLARPLANAAYSWNAFTSVLETKSCFLFFVQPRQAVNIPKSAFPSREAAMEARRRIVLGVRHRFVQRGVAEDERVHVV